MAAVVISAMHMSTGVDFQMPTEYAKSLRRADDLTKWVVGCAGSAFKSVALPKIPPEEIGIFYGTSFGPLETNFRFLDTLLDDGERQVSPTLFSHSVHNAVTGYLARILKIHGPSITLTTYTWPFLTALNQAVQAISNGLVRRALVATAEMPSPLLADASRQFSGSQFTEGPSGAVTWIVDKFPEEIKGKQHIIIKHLEIHETPCDAKVLLTRSGEVWSCNGRENEQTTGVLAYAFSLTDQIKKTIAGQMSEEFFLSIKAPFGQAKLTLVKG
jgi:hypothetical protein